MCPVTALLLLSFLQRCRAFASRLAVRAGDWQKRLWTVGAGSEPVEEIREFLALYKHCLCLFPRPPPHTPYAVVFVFLVHLPRLTTTQRDMPLHSRKILL